MFCPFPNFREGWDGLSDTIPPSVIHHNSYSFPLLITEYVYSFSVNGSNGILSSFDRFACTVSQIVHCVHTTAQLYVISIPFVGFGYLPASR
ncbi:MAG: hypothetical protein Q8S84_06995 [bacterium]|nr:hypothetical protein [bacterium]MDP3381204.1 hypothetical protein [bacterium]